MKNSPRACKLLEPTHGETGSLSHLLTTTEGIGSQEPPDMKSPGPRGFTGEFHRTLRRDINPPQLLQKTKRKKHVPTHSETHATWMARPKTSRGNDGPTAFMNTDVKVLRETAANDIQQHNENVIRHHQVVLPQDSGGRTGLRRAVKRRDTPVTGENHVTFPGRRKGI